MFLLPVITFFMYAILATPLLRNPLTTFQILVECIVGMYVVLAWTNRAYRPRWNMLTCIFLALTGVLFVTSFFGVDWRQSLWSTPMRGIGVVAYAHYTALFLVLTWIAPLIHWRRLFAFSFAVSVINALVALVWFTDRPGGLFGNPTFLASYLLFHIFLGVWLAYQWRNARWWISATIIFSTVGEIIVLILTQTRGALLGLAIGAIMGCVTGSVVFKKRWLGFAAIFFVMMASAFWITRTSPLWKNIPGLNRFAGDSLSSLSAGRVIAWQAAWQGIVERPLRGWGWENFDVVFNHLYQPSLARMQFGETFFSKPHNIFLEYALAGGIGALVLFLLFIGACWYRARLLTMRGDPIGAVIFPALLMAYCVQGFFLFDIQASLLILVVIAAYGASGSLKTSAAPEFKSFSVGWRRPLIIFGVVVLAIYVINYYSDPYRDFVLMENIKSLQKSYRESGSVPGSVLRINEAMQSLEDVMRRRPQNYFSRVLYADAVVTFFSDNPAYLARARLRIDESLRISPRRQQSYYIRAKIQLAEKNPAGAVATMREAVTLDSKAGDPHFFAGLIAFIAGDTKTGFLEIERAKELGREPRDNHEARVVADHYGDVGRYVEALHYYKKALAYNPDDVLIIFNQALVEYYAGNRVAARNELADITRRFPDFLKTSRYQSARPILRQLGL